MSGRMSRWKAERSSSNPSISLERHVKNAGPTLLTAPHVHRRPNTLHRRNTNHPFDFVAEHSSSRFHDSHVGDTRRPFDSGSSMKVPERVPGVCFKFESTTADGLGWDGEHLVEDGSFSASPRNRLKPTANPSLPDAHAPAAISRAVQPRRGLPSSPCARAALLARHGARLSRTDSHATAVQRWPRLSPNRRFAYASRRL